MLELEETLEVYLVNTGLFSATGGRGVVVEPKLSAKLMYDPLVIPTAFDALPSGCTCLSRCAVKSGELIVFFFVMLKVLRLSRGRLETFLLIINRSSSSSGFCLDLVFPPALKGFPL